ncbi:hypothetical protein IT575_15080 [bacterium]|nr:hypothetical protein [bacterium]
MSATPQSFPAAAQTGQQSPDLGRKYEGIAFTFCKASTLAILAQLIAGPKYILPLIAIGTAIWYAVALLHGQKTTRCLLRVPLLIIAFWTLIGAWFAWRAWQGFEPFSLLGMFGRGGV